MYVLCVLVLTKKSSRAYPHSIKNQSSILHDDESRSARGSFATTCPLYQLQLLPTSAPLPNIYYVTIRVRLGRTWRRRATYTEEGAHTHMER